MTVLSGCGNSGALYLPRQPVDQNNQQSQSAGAQAKGVNQ